MLVLALAAPRLASCQAPQRPPCKAATHLTCAGAPGLTGPSICCNKMNFGCSVRSDTGAPRCAMCPSFCPDCEPGFKCGNDAKGCKTCVKDLDPANSLPGFVRTCQPLCKASQTCQRGKGNVKPVCVPLERRNRRLLDL